MDLDKQLYLRSFIRPSSAPIIKAISLALVFHVFVLIDYFSINNISQAEIPQWVNIKLVAGFEEEKEFVKKIKPDTVNKQTENKKLSHKSAQQPQQEPPIEAVKKDSTFVKADSRPFLIKNPKPIYPIAAKRRGMQGVVILRVEVSKFGKVNNVIILHSSGFNILDRSALRSVQVWQFMPASDDGSEIASVVELPIKFILNDEVT